MRASLNVLPLQAKPAERAVRVGIPRAMGYYGQDELWARFFRHLGCGVLLSPPTSQEILDVGVRIAVTELCLPVKVLAGHIAWLAARADVLFLPRSLSRTAGEMTCPKACALPDLARFFTRGKIPVWETDIDPDRWPKDWAHRAFAPLAARMGTDEETLRAAFAAAKEEESPPRARTRGPALALLGHPYVLDDPYVSRNVAEKLRAGGYAVLTPENLSLRERRADIRPYTGRDFYAVGLDLIGAAHAFATRPEVAGIVCLSPFGCGIDAMAAAHVAHFLQKAERKIPFLLLTIDEQTGDAGLDTRIEAFLEMAGEKA